MNMHEDFEKAVKALHQNEQFFVPALAARANKAAQANPHDASLVTASNVLKKMASDNKSFITRGELNSIYDQLYTRNSKLSEVFAEELDRAELPGPRTFHRSELDGKPLTYDYAKMADPILVNALSSAFDGTKEAKLYSSKVADKAERVCSMGLEAQGLMPKKVSIFAGKHDVLVCDAAYETPKGESHVLVPVEVQDENALMPTMFLSQAGFADLDEDNLKQHIKDTAGKSFKVDGQKLLNILSMAKDGPQETINVVDMALSKLRAKGETSAEYAGGFLYTEVDHVTPDVASPEFGPEPEIDSFAQRMSTPVGIAKYMFGDKLIQSGIDMLSRKLKSFGYTQPQISVNKSDKNSISYAVKVGTSTGFNVPVEVQDNLLIPPTIAIASGKIGEFSKVGLMELMEEASPDNRALAVASPVYGEKPHELVETVRKALEDGNYHKAEDAIDVLAEIDENAYKSAISLMFQYNNVGFEKAASMVADECSNIVHSSVSKYPLCGHLNLPLNKVYQDKYGNCRPSSRKGHEEGQEGGIFLANHILLGIK